MRKQLDFKLDMDTSSIIKLTKDYFVQSGFNVASESSDEIVFERGSSIQNMVTFNPLNWKSKTRIQIKNNEVTADFDINNPGHNVLSSDEKLWDSFIHNFKRSIIDNVDLADENKNLVLAAKKDSWNKVKWLIMGALIFGVPSGFLGYFTGLDMLAPLGAAGGGMIFMMYKISEESKKNAL